MDSLLFVLLVFGDTYRLSTYLPCELGGGGGGRVLGHKHCIEETVIVIVPTKPNLTFVRKSFSGCTVFNRQPTTNK